jgi:endonuclease/exonuclease/phosphatase family metal-dependent hydrolase
VYNVHLDHESQPSREKSSAMLAQRIGERSPKVPVLVTGDFNSGEQNAAVKTMMKPDGAGLRDSFRIKYPEEKNVGTFNSFGKAAPGTEKIDYIFVEPGVVVRDAAIDRRSKEGRFPSDHFAVWANLELPQAK